eukprot:c16033_g1_i3.p1 GENE.c16033_g1_i3~~c16033_g1_i3.p1  ORF type:complete len:138 (+),score=61.99 c16033_g1_i3:53-466(+)
MNDSLLSPSPSPSPLTLLPSNESRLLFPQLINESGNDTNRQTKFHDFLKTTVLHSENDGVYVAYEPNKKSTPIWINGNPNSTTVLFTNNNLNLATKTSLPIYKAEVVSSIPIAFSHPHPIPNLSISPSISSNPNPQP